MFVFVLDTKIFCKNENEIHVNIIGLVCLLFLVPWFIDKAFVFIIILGTKNSVLKLLLRPNVYFLTFFILLELGITGIFLKLSLLILIFTLKLISKTKQELERSKYQQKKPHRSRFNMKVIWCSRKFSGIGQPVLVKSLS